MALDFDTFNERFAQRFPDKAGQTQLRTWIEESNQVAVENFFQSLSLKEQVWFVRILWYLEDEQFNAICQLAGLNVTRERILDHRQLLVTFPASLIVRDSNQTELNLACCLLAECLVKRLCSIKFNHTGHCRNDGAADVIIKELIALCLPSRLVLEPKLASNAGNGIYRAIQNQHINSKPGLELPDVNLKNNLFQYCKDHRSKVYDIIGNRTLNALSRFISDMILGEADPEITLKLLMTALKRPIITIDKAENLCNLSERFQIEEPLESEPFFLEQTTDGYKSLEVKREYSRSKLSDVLSYLKNQHYLPLVLHQYLAIRLAELDISDQHRHLFANRSQKLSPHTDLMTNLGLAASLLSPLEQGAMNEAMQFAFETLNTPLLNVLLHPNDMPLFLDIPLTPTEVTMNKLKENNVKLTECTKKEWLIVSQRKLLKLLLQFMQQWKAASKWPAVSFNQFEHTLTLSKERAVLNENGSSNMEAYNEKTRIKWSQQSELVESVLIRMGKKIDNFLVTRDLSALEHAELYSNSLRAVRGALLDLNAALQLKFNTVKKTERDKLVNILTTMIAEKKEQYESIRAEHDTINNQIVNIETSLITEKKKIINDYLEQRSKNASSINREEYNDYTYKTRFIDTLFSGGFTADLTSLYFKWQCYNDEIILVTPIEWFILRYFPQRYHDLLDQTKENPVNLISDELQSPLREQSNLIDYKPKYDENNYQTISWFARSLSKSGKTGLQTNEHLKKENPAINSVIKNDNDFFALLELKSDSDGEEYRNDLMSNEQNDIHQALFREFPSEQLLEKLGVENKPGKKSVQELMVFNIEKMLFSSRKKSNSKANDILALVLRSNDIDLICRIINYFDIKLTPDKINCPDMNCYDWTLLHKAIFYLHTPFCLQLLEQGASINLADNNQWTPGTMIVKLNRLFHDKMNEIISPYKEAGNSSMPGNLQYDYLSLGSMRNGLRLVYERMIRLVADKKMMNQLTISPYLKEMQTYLAEMKKELLSNSPGWLRKLLSPEKVNQWNENKSAYLRLNSSQKEAELAQYFDDPLLIEVIEIFPENKQPPTPMGSIITYMVESTNKALTDVNHSPNSVTRKINLLEEENKKNEIELKLCNEKIQELAQLLEKANIRRSLEIHRSFNVREFNAHFFVPSQNNNNSLETNSFQRDSPVSPRDASNNNVTPSLIN